MGDRLKMIRLTGKSLELADELVEEFNKKGYQSSFTAVVNSAVPLLHGVTLGGYNVVSYAEQLEQRAQDVGTSIAAILGGLSSAKMDMSGCQLGYLPAVDAITIRLDATDDFLIHAGGADPAMIANVVKTQLLERGYLQDDRTVLVDMEKLIGTPVQGN